MVADAAKHTPAHLNLWLQELFAPMAPLSAGSESPIFLATAVQPDEVVFLEVELLMGGGKRWHCFLIWNPRHKAMAAMRQVTSCFH